MEERKEACFWNNIKGFNLQFSEEKKNQIEIKLVFWAWRPKQSQY
jgi:hypothetical protein